MQLMLEQLIDGEELSHEDAKGAMLALLQGQVDDVHATVFLTALRMRGESPAELAGFVQALRSCAKKPQHPVPKGLDTCGTGGDNSGTFNVSTASALLCAAAGVRVAKHGNRAASSMCGSADVIEALGIPFNDEENESFTFYYAPNFHPVLAEVASLRRKLRIPTLFNLLGPFLNPAQPSYQLIGVARSEQLGLIAETLVELGHTQAFVVHGEPGIDEATPAGPFHLLKVHDGDYHGSYMNADDFGLPPCQLSDIRGGNAQHNASIIQSVFSGERSAYRDTVVLNTALSLLLIGRFTSSLEAARYAESVIDSGEASTFLSSLRSPNYVA